MAAVLPFRRTSISRAVSPLVDSGSAPNPLSVYTDRQRDVAELREALIQPALQKMRDGVAAKVAAQWLASTGADGLPSWQTIERWLHGYKRQGITALVDQRAGRQPTKHAWHIRAWQLYRLRSQPNAGDITNQLRDEGHADATYSRVLAFIKRIPANEGEFAPSRIGASYRRANHTPKKTRDVSDLEVGAVWVADGHKVKVLCRNSVTGNFYRLEMTPILDVRSHYWFNTWYSRAESSASSVNVFCSTVHRYGRPPDFFYTDNGSGFANHRTAAMFRRIGTEHLTAQAGAPYSKGMGEAIFLFVINRLAKFAFPDAYCGEDTTDDVIARYASKWKRGEIYIPTDVEVIDAINGYRARYNATPQPRSKRLDGMAPDDFISQLKPAPDRIPLELMLWEERDCTVRKATVQFSNLSYASLALLGPYEGRQVRVMFDGEDSRQIWVFDGRGRYIGPVALDETVPFMAPSVYQQRRERNLELAVERKALLARRIQDDAAGAITHNPESQLPLSHQLLEQGHSLTVPAGPAALPNDRTSAEQLLRDLDGFGAVVLPQKEQAEGLQPLDLLDTDY